MAAQNKSSGNAVTSGAGARTTTAVDSSGHLTVSELVSDRAAAPSPFGDDQTFPLPVEHISYTPLKPA